MEAQGENKYLLKKMMMVPLLLLIGMSVEIMKDF